MSEPAWARAYRLSLDSKHVLASDETGEPLLFAVTLGFQSCFAELRCPAPAPTVGTLRLEAGYRGGLYRTIFDGDIVNRKRGKDQDWLVARRHTPMRVVPGPRPVIDAAGGLIGYVETKKGDARARMLLRPDLVPGSMAELPGGLVCRIVGVEHTGDTRSQPWYSDVFGYRLYPE